MILPIKHEDKTNYLQYAKRLSRLSFLDYPACLQLIIIAFFGVFLFWLVNVKILHSKLEIMQNDKRIQDLVQMLDGQKKFIEAVKQYKNRSSFKAFLGRMDVLHSINFIQQISSLAKKEKIEIHAIKPIAHMPESFSDLQGINMKIRLLQVEMIGKYRNIIGFLFHVSERAVRMTIGDFQIASLLDAKDELQLPADPALKLTATIYLYGYAR